MPKTACQLSKTEIEGFGALVVNNGLISVAVIPALGGKIVSMRDLRADREWLWKGTQLDYKLVGHGASYLRDGDFGGWDECFPSVAESPDPNLPGETVPDHGDLWSQPWKMSHRQDGGSVILSGQCGGVSWPYQFHRDLVLRDGSADMTLRYKVVNESDRPLKFIWSAHPLFQVDGTALIETSEPLDWNTFLTFPSNLPGGVPQMRAGSDNEIQVPENDVGVAYKVWSEPVPKKAFSSRLVSGDCALRFDFDGDSIPNLGIWINKGGFAGRDEWTGLLNNLAVEPCIGAQDRLDEAVERYGQYGEIAAGEAAKWSLTVGFEQVGADGQGARA